MISTTAIARYISLPNSGSYSLLQDSKHDACPSDNSREWTPGTHYAVNSQVVTVRCDGATPSLRSEVARSTLVGDSVPQKNVSLASGVANEYRVSNTMHAAPGSIPPSWSSPLLKAR